MSSTTYVGAALALSALLSPSAANADLVTFTFAGQIVRLDGDVGFLGGTIPVGTPFSGSYTFDSNTPDIRPDNPEIGNYDRAITALSLQLGSHALSGINADGQGIRVANDFEGYDNYVAVDGLTPLLGRFAEGALFFSDSNAAAFKDDGLPLVPFGLDPFEDRQLVVGPPDGSFFLVGEISFLAPEPATLLMFGLASFSITSRRHR